MPGKLAPHNERAGDYLGVVMIVQADPFQSSARVRRLPATVRNPTVRQLLPPQETDCKSEPRPADTARSACHSVPFHQWIPAGPPSVMQFVALAHATWPVQLQTARPPVQSTPRSGETSVHDVLPAFQVPATAIPPPSTSLYAPPVARQKPPAQPTAFDSAGLPSATPGGSVLAQVLPFQKKPIGS